MADRVLEGGHLGPNDYETDRNRHLAPLGLRATAPTTARVRRSVRRRRRDSHTWLCRNGMEGTLIEGDAPEPKKVKPPRTHWDMLLERRSVVELEELLKERLDLIKARRRGN